MRRDADDATGEPLPQATLDAAKAADAVLLAAVGGPKWDTTDPNAPRPEQGLLGIRKGLGLLSSIGPGIDAVAKAERRSLGDDRPALSGCKAGKFAEHDCFPVAALAGNEHEPSRCSSTVFEPLREIVDNWLSADKQRGNFSCGGFERILSQAGLASIFFS